FFAPNDDAFKALPQDQIDALLKNDTLLQEVLMYHVVPGRYAAANLSTAQALTTALTSTVLTVSGTGTGVTINEAVIVSPTLAASNGLVYEIASVLLPTQVSAAAPSPSGTALITGTVSYLPRIALDPEAVIEVQLQDVSAADAPAKTIASQSIDANGQQVPIAFELAYDPAVVNAQNRYVLAVRISVGGQLRFVNTTAIPVLTNGARSTNVEVLVDPVSGVASAAQVTPTLSTLTGTLTLPSSVTIPAAAIVDVQLNDTTVVTAPVIVAAAQSVVTKRSGALTYTLKYDPALIDLKRTYALTGRVLVDGRPIYANSGEVAVLTFDKPFTGIAVPLAAVSDGKPADDLVTITGTLDIDAAALDSAAVIEVQLQDVSRTDAPAEVVSVQVITPAQTAAIPFTLYYNPYAIDPAHHYQLSARVTVSAEVLYENTEQYPVLTAGQLTDVALRAEALSIAAVTPTATPTPTSTPAPVAGAGVLTGTITAAQAINLPANAEILVKLLDVSRVDAPSQVVAEQTIDVDGRQLPRPFTLNYDAAQIDATHYYMLLVTISVNGELGWLNPQAVWALTYGNAAGSISVPVQPVP
ncbi:MAG: YbaY family lipoprotein, partial [Chloroflexi bacterium]|nr:YbaY family lipoprotein [Chloroflexota bacterium]